MPRAEARRPAPIEAPTVASWVPLAGVLLAMAGLGLTGYLTVEHYTASATLACPGTGVVNCQKVTSSARSVAFGMPVALLGLLFFAAMLPLGLPAAWRSPRPLPRWSRAGLTLVGVAFVFYLVYTELFTLNAICLWCTAVHAVTVALFAVVAIGTATTEPDRSPDAGGPVG
jgi:uncharacterized membrane protein